MIAAVVSWDRVLNLIQVYFGDGLEMAGHSAVRLGKTAQSLLIHIMVWKYMSLLAT